MSVLSSPSPTLSPSISASPYSHSHSHDRTSSYASSLRRAGSHRSYRLSPSSSQVFTNSHASSPAPSVHSSTLQLTPTTAPKRRAVDEYSAGQGQKPSRASSVDVGTQYTPPDFPPTAKRSMTSTSTVSLDATATALDGSDEIERTRTSTPPEPSLRQDPEPHTPTGTSNDSASASNVSETSSLLSSPSKRARGEASRKIMPLDYMKCDIRDLGIVISDMLLELIRINDPLPVRNEQLTRYHSRFVIPYTSLH